MQQHQSEDFFAGLDQEPVAGVINGQPIDDDRGENGLLATAAEARAFINAGKATFTLVSKATASRFTYKVNQAKDGGVQFVALLNGSDNENSFAYIGYIKRGVYFHGNAKSRVGREAPSNKAFEWAWRKLAQDEMPTCLEVWHEGRCGRCNRKLTVPSSIRSGIGPECASKMGG